MRPDSTTGMAFQFRIRIWIPKGPRLRDNACWTLDKGPLSNQGSIYERGGYPRWHSLIRGHRCSSSSTSISTTSSSSSSVSSTSSTSTSSSISPCSTTAISGCSSVSSSGYTYNNFYSGCGGMYPSISIPCCTTCESVPSRLRDISAVVKRLPLRTHHLSRVTANQNLIL